jgi:hypothetical protein
MKRKVLFLVGLSLLVTAPLMAEPSEDGRRMRGQAAEPAGRSHDSLFSFLFMARKTTSVTEFDNTRTDTRVRKNTAPGSEGFVTGTQVQTISGSTERREDAVTWEVTSSQDIDSAMGEVLTTAGIEYAAYDDVMINGGGPDPAVIKSEFVKKDDLSAQTRAKVISASRKCDVRYLATGTIDIGLQDVDPVSGNKRVYVSVRANLWDISLTLPRKIGSVGPVQFSGLGPDQSVASRNALIIAAKETALSLVDQLNNKGVR